MRLLLFTFMRRRSLYISVSEALHRTLPTSSPGAHLVMSAGQLIARADFVQVAIEDHLAVGGAAVATHATGISRIENRLAS